MSDYPPPPDGSWACCHHRPPGDPSWGMSLTDLERNFGHQLIAIAVVAVISVGAAYALRRRKDWIFGLNPPASCLAIGSALAIAIGTLTRQSDAWSHGRLQLIPLHTLRNYLHDRGDLLIYVGGNVALFMPLGFFIYLALRRWVFGTALVCAVASICVEILQIPIWSRSTDVDDVLTNTLGGFLGAAAGFVVLRLIRARARTTEAQPISEPSTVR